MASGLIFERTPQNARAFSTAALFHTRGMRLRRSAPARCLCPTVDAYTGSYTQRDQASCDGSPSHRASRDLGLAAARSRSRPFMLCMRGVSNDTRAGTYGASLDAHVDK